MRLLLLLILLVSTSCFSTAKPLSTLQECRKVCRSGVEFYEDDNLTCKCFKREMR